jgi:hypothetical protein
MDYQTLSDKDLIQRYCAIQSDQSAFGELWRRYEPTLRKYARHLTFRKEWPEGYMGTRGEQHFPDGSGALPTVQPLIIGAKYWVGVMCPHFYSRDLFFEEVFSIASEPRELVEFTEEELVQRGAVFGDKIRQDPMHHAVRSERKAMLDDIMGRHAASEEGYRSISAIIFNVLYDYTVRQVAEILGTYERDIFRLFKADYPRLRAALAARGIRCVRDALTSQE